jgi:hypothetical protein
MQYHIRVSIDHREYSVDRLVPSGPLRILWQSMNSSNPHIIIIIMRVSSPTNIYIYIYTLYIIFSLHCWFSSLSVCCLLSLLLDLEDGATVILRSVSKLLHDFVASHCRRYYSFTITITWSIIFIDRLCGIVVRLPTTDPEVPDSIPGATRFFWEVVDLERGPLSLVSTI